MAERDNALTKIPRDNPDTRDQGEFSGDEYERFVHHISDLEERGLLHPAVAERIWKQFGTMNKSRQMRRLPAIDPS